MLSDKIKYARKLPPFITKPLKRAFAPVRYSIQAKKCRKAYDEYGANYKHHFIFVAGLPKSGTTWLEKMISSYPGFNEILIPDVTSYEMSHRGSNEFELPDDMFERFEGMLLLTKMHIHGSEHNAEIIKAAGVRYVILYRDLRDVAISHYHYVRLTPWHPEYQEYIKLDINEGINFFAETSLELYRNWIYKWNKNRDPELSIVLRYEDMLREPESCLRKVLNHYELPYTDERLSEIIESNSFAKLSGGRQSGQSDNKSFFRSGKSGGWKAIFDDSNKQSFKEVAGQAFIDFGWETDLDW